MAARFWALGLLLGSSACGLTIDADRFRNVSDGGTEPPDVRLHPPELEEGAGGLPSVGRGAALLVTGGPFSDDAALMSDDARLTVSASRVSDDRSVLAVRVWVAPFEDLPRGESATVALTVMDAGTTHGLSLTIQGLDELDLAGRVDPSSIRGRFSRIRTMGPVEIVGAAGLRLESAGAVLIDHALDLSARAAEPGPGGLAAGEGSRAGSTGDSAARGCAGGGAGAGGVEAGEDSPGGASGGAAAPRPRGLPRSDGGGHGGGHGGDQEAAPGKSGGGGGGWIRIVGATVALNADLLVSGADGEDADDNNCGGSDNAGAGGGGAGGWIRVRADASLGAEGGLVVTGGDGGGGGPKAGGNGADGWVRIDAPRVDARATGRDGRVAVWRGPAWANLDDPLIEAGAALAVVGEPGTRARYAVDGDRVGDIELDERGRGSVEAPSPGAHTVCLSLGGEESSACAQIAVLP